MLYLPDEVFDRLKDLKGQQAAKVLAVGFFGCLDWFLCRSLTRNETLSKKLGINSVYLSTAKSLLIREGWFMKDPEFAGYGVIPLIGVKELEERRIWKFQNSKEEKRNSLLNSQQKFWNFQTKNLDIPKNFSLSPYITYPSKSTTTTSSDEENLDIPNFPLPEKIRRSHEATDEYVEAMIAAGAYNPRLNPDLVRYIWRDYKFDCMQRPKPKTPDRREFKGWLNNYREPVQLKMPNVAAPLQAPDFTAPKPTPLPAHSLRDALYTPDQLSPLDYFQVLTGKSLSRYDRECFERYAEADPVLLKAAIAKSIILARSTVRNFSYCTHVIEEFLSPEGGFSRDYFYGYLTRQLKEYFAEKFLSEQLEDKSATEGGS
jgi:hypothetical protein